jgi:glycosyltransferase involved in cell wall biosynthesis
MSIKEVSSPFVSVAIITFNQKDFLIECIESILEQDYSNIEIVVADDCSTDGTQDLLHEYSLKFPGKFVLRLSPENTGITQNSNAAFYACSGKYIAWMGGDDLMLPGKLKKQVDFMESNEVCSISYHNLDVFESDSNETLYYFNEKNKINGDVITSIRNGTFNGACSTMVRTVMCPKSGFDIRVPVASDWLFWVETLANGGSICYLDEVLGRYRRHENNVTKKYEHVGSNELDHLNSCNIILAKYPIYTADVFYAYSYKLLGLRHKLSYGPTMSLSFSINKSLKVLGALVIYYLSFGKVKL